MTSGSTRTTLIRNCSTGGSISMRRMRSLFPLERPVVLSTRAGSFFGGVNARDADAASTSRASSRSREFGGDDLEVSGESV